MRPTNIIGLSLCIVSLLIAYFFFEQQLNLEPCPLCILDRFALVLLGIVFFAGFFVSSITWRYRLAFINLINVGLGLLFSGRHVWIQNQEFDFETTVCLADSKPITDFIAIIKNSFQANADCGLISFELFGISLPGLTLILFMGILLLICMQIYAIYQDNLDDE